MPANLEVDISICLHESHLPLDTVDTWPGTELKLRILRRASRGRWRSAVLQLAPGERFATVGLDRPAIQIFVIEGEIEVNRIPVGSNGFVVLPAGSLVSASRDTKAIMILCGPDEYAPPAPVLIRDCLDLPATAPEIGGKRMEGFERRVLWLDEIHGSDTRLLKIPGGFAGGGPNWHPVNEEIFCLSGDIQPDDTRPMGPGSYLFNPARSIHGFSEKTEKGCVLLEWHDGPWELVPAAGVSQPA